MPRTYEQINGYEREVIAQMLKEQAGWTAIGQRLGRAPSTIYREYGRNRGEDGYLPGRADERARARRKVARRPRKVVGACGRRVRRLLRRYWSPEQVSGRSRLEGHPPVAATTIYRYVNSPEGADCRSFLRGPGGERRHNRRVHERIHNRVMIDQRPCQIEARDQVGHWEGDTVRGPMKSRSCVMSLVERTSQYLIARLLNNRTGSDLNQAAIRAMRAYPFASLTVDNGMEFASHQRLTEITGVQVYFAHEQCPWERGLNEQVNGLLRQFFPKGTDFAKVAPEQLRRAEALINDRPRKSLGYRTPREVMQGRSFALVT